MFNMSFDTSTSAVVLSQLQIDIAEAGLFRIAVSMF